MTQEEFNRRQQQAVDYLDDAREKLKKAEQAIDDVNGFLDDAEGELDYLKDYEGKEEVEPNCVFKYEKDTPINLYHDLNISLLQEILKLSKTESYTITLKMFVE